MRPIFAWYDFWVGVFYDKRKSILYILPIPMIGLKIELKQNETTVDNSVDKR